MCMSRLYRVRGNVGTSAVDVEDVEGALSRASLLALDGAPPAPGDWVVVHSGYVINRVDSLEAEGVAQEIRRGAGRSLASEDGEVRS
jgi:hydrogenase maturation factor